MYLENRFLTLAAVVVVSMGSITTSFASNAGENCLPTKLANGASVRVCRGLLSSTYSVGGNILRFNFILNQKADCQTDMSNLPSTTVWLKAGRGETLLSNESGNNDRTLPVHYELVGNYDNSGTCQLSFSAAFTEYSAQFDADPQVREINRLMMNDTNTEINFAVSIDGKWDSQYGQNYHVWVKQYP